ncbi:MAG: hypothetical protein DRI44_01370 [Chlamydiae bacterium]|nr:MAG: hypothetical protein DRI44_01370 [Chlamydiota bacterium]
MTEDIKNNPEITIAFLNYNTAEDLIRAINSVPEACGNIDYHITVIDNCSTDDSVEQLRKYDDRLDILILEKNFGFAAGFNKIFSHINTPYYFLLNSDIILSPGCVKKILTRVKENSKIGIAGVKLIRENGSPQTSFGKFPSLASELLNRSLWQKIYAKRITDNGQQITGHDTSLTDVSKNPGFYDVDCIIGAAMFLPRSTFEKVGRMDEDFFFFLEETDWCKRIQNAGLIVAHFPDIEITHLQGKSANKVPVKARIEFHRSRLHYFKKHCGTVAAAILWSGCFLRLIINCTAMFLLTIFTLGKSEKFKNKMKLYAGVLIWYLKKCPKSGGLNSSKDARSCVSTIIY